MKNKTNKNQIYILKLEEHLIDIDPKTYNLSDIPHIKPHTYFITSGEAVAKAEKLNRDLCQLYKQLVTIKENANKNLDNYIKAVHKCVTKSKIMVERLKEIRGDNLFLETEWNNHEIICVAKNARVKP